MRPAVEICDAVPFDCSVNNKKKLTWKLSLRLKRA